RWTFSYLNPLKKNPCLDAIFFITLTLFIQNSVAILLASLRSSVTYIIFQVSSSIRLSLLSISYSTVDHLIVYVHKRIFPFNLFSFSSVKLASYTLYFSLFIFQITFY